MLQLGEQTGCKPGMLMTVTVGMEWYLLDLGIKGGEDWLGCLLGTKRRHLNAVAFALAGFLGCRRLALQETHDQK